MICWKILVIFKFILISNQILCVRVHTEFGDYKHRIKQELWHPECGLRHVPKEKGSSDSNKCFKWKTPFRELMSVQSNSDTNKNDLNIRITNGEIASEGEAPWAVFVLGCGGVILNKKWVLTAAHCIDDYSLRNESIYVGNNDRTKGTKYTVERVYRHNKYRPNYKGLSDSCLYDIGLINIKEEILFNIVNDRYVTNSVCLPKKGVRNERKEFAIMYGWGRYSDVNNYSSKRLLKGKFLIQNSSYLGSPCLCSDFKDKETSHSPLVCVGDSGSGLIQFIGANKRAVVIGISSKIIRDKHPHCGDSKSQWSPVSLHIDWILKVMTEN